jgi:hypothetical protein
VRRLGLVIACLALTCGSLPPYEAPEERVGSLPLTRADQTRSGELTWRAGELTQTEGGVLFEFTLSNGSSRHYYSVMLRLVLRGAGSALATVRYPAGPFAAGQSRRIRAHLAPPGFAVEGADVELLFAQE